MAFVPGFDHDVFISYAHIDNLRRTEGQEGWVKKFRDELDVAVRSVLGRAEGLSIWRDPALQGNDDFAEKIREAYRTSAVMISVLSPSYIASSWCQEEVHQFCTLAGGTLTMNGTYRLFKVRLSHVELEQQPPPMPALLGYDFFELEKETGRETRFRRTLEADPDQRYWDKLNDLARAIAGVLKALKIVKEAPAAIPPRTIFSSPTIPSSVVSPTSLQSDTVVYLAEVADDMEDYRDQVQRTLKQRGIHVLPEAPLSPYAPDFIERVQQDLTTATFSVHLIGELYGKKINGERSLIHTQSELAAEVARTRAEQPQSQPFTRVFWTPKDIQLDTLSQTQQAFLTAIENALDSSSEWLRVDLEELKERVLAKARPPAPAPQTAVDDPLVCIAYAPEDTTFAAAIKDYLYKQQQLSIVLVGSTQDEAALQRRLQKNIQHCDALLICYGQGSADWVEETALEARTLTKSRSQRPLMCLYDGPPPDKEELPFLFRDVLVIKHRQPFSAESMRMFLQRLGRRV